MMITANLGETKITGDEIVTTATEKKSTIRMIAEVQFLRMTSAGLGRIASMGRQTMREGVLRTVKT